MRRLISVAACAALSLLAAGAQPVGKRPKLVLVVMVDQFRYDYLQRFRADYKGGLARLMDQGAFFTNARYTHFPLVTAVGHSVILSGAPPAISGIAANAWYSREDKRIVTSVCDDAATVVGVPSKNVKPGEDCNDSNPASPRRMLVDTVGDELRMVSEQSRVVGVSLKARAAILPAGHMANGAYWFDDAGQFVTSSYYMDALPSWAATFNAARPADQFAGRKWFDQVAADPGPELYKSLPGSPWGNELVLGFAKAAIAGEKLGQRGVTDLLTVSFSSNDYVGHRVGPDAPEVKDMSIRTDAVLADLFAYIDAQGVGMENTVVVLSADHGVAPTPEKDQERKMPGLRLSPGQLGAVANDALVAKYGPGKWLVEKAVEYELYLNQELIQTKGLRSSDVYKVAAEALAAKPYVYRVYTRDQLWNGIGGGDRIASAMMKGFYPSRSGDIFVLLPPYWLTSMSGTTHGTPFNYDNHVPVVFMGPGIRKGWFHTNISVTDVAPTLSTLLGIEMPAGADGRALGEIFSEN